VRQKISVGNIAALMTCRAGGSRGKDTALQQAVIEKGGQVLMDLTNSPFRVAIPISFPGIVTLGLLLWRFPYWAGSCWPVASSTGSLRFF
jgi:hypothetical protein